MPHLHISIIYLYDIRLIFPLSIYIIYQYNIYMNDRKMMTTRLSASLLKEMKIIAAKMDSTLNSEIENAMKEYVDRFKKKENKKK